MDTLDELAAIFNARSARKRRRLVEEFHAARFGERKLYFRWAARIRSTLGLRHVELDDVAQEVAAVAVELVDEWEPGWSSKSWEGLAYTIILRRLRAAVDRGQWHGFTGTSTEVRRQRKLRATKEEMSRELMREPTAEEVVERYNAQIRETWSDPKRSGMVATVDDLSFDSFTTANIDTAAPDASVPDDDECVLSPFESPELMVRVFDVVAETNPGWRVICETWMGPPSERGEWAFLSPSVVASQLGIPLGEVRRCILEVRAVAANVLYHDHGISAADWLSEQPVA